MMRRPARLALIGGVLLIVLLILGRLGVDLYTELLWFQQLGYQSVMWRQLAAMAAVRVVTGALGAAIVLANLLRVVRHLGPVQLRRRYGNLEIAEQIPHGYVTAGIVLAALLAGWWLSGLSIPSDEAPGVLAWIQRTSWGIRDPLLHRDLGFYVFSLPLLDRFLDFLLLVTVWSAVLALVGYVLVGAVRLRGGHVEVENYPKVHFAILVAGLVLLIAARYWMGRYAVVLHGGGFGGVVGYTDVNARLPAYQVLTLVSVLTAAAIVYSVVVRNWLPTLVSVGILLLAGLGLGIAYPSFVQKLRVVPNELAREEPYIRMSLEFTRRGFGLEDLERAPLTVHPQPTSQLRELSATLDRLPLWDATPLQAYFNQVQSLVAYYHFESVHFDRYGPPNAETQVAIAVREFARQGLPAATWRTLHLNADQVRGNGAVVAPVSEKTEDGNPVFWLRSVTAAGDTAAAASIRREAGAPGDLVLNHPNIFFGESDQEYLIVNAPRDSSGSGAQAARAGVPLGTFLRVFAYAWRFGDRNLLFSSELTPTSRLLFRRSVQERVATLAPFLGWDPRPLPVILDGHIVWLVDGYTYSRTFPLSAGRTVGDMGTVSYLRNSVKATVDAITGETRLYAIDPQEPILAAYARAFPGLFHPLQDMPLMLQRHLRYPQRLLQVQAQVLEKFHVDSASVFFAGQREWQVPQEGAGSGLGRDYPPIYLLAPMPGGTRPEFLLALPFIARDRQNMTAILLVQNDAPHYGRKLLLELPLDQQVSGPQQVRTLIEQDPVISAQLTLWRQGGSDVEIGRLRVVPLDGSVLYVEPLYLSGSNSSIPQLQRVVISDGTTVAMAENMDAAVAAIRGANESGNPVANTPPAAGTLDWPRQALDLMQQAERALRALSWDEFGRRWKELQDLLRRAAGNARK